MVTTFKGTLKRRMLTYGQKTSQDVSYMTSWDETALKRFLCVNYKTQNETRL